MINNKVLNTNTNTNTKKLFVLSFFLAFLLLSLCMVYFVTPLVVDKALTVFFIAIFAFLLIAYFYTLSLAGVLKHPFSLTLLFVISFFIVFLQVPIDYVLGNIHGGYFDILIYDHALLNLNVLFVVIFFGFFLLGIVQQTKVTIKKNKIVESRAVIRKKVPEWPFFGLFYTFFLLHLITIDPGYYYGAIKEDPQGLAGSILGYFLRTLPICFGVLIYNSKISGEKYNFLTYIKKIPKPFLVLLLLFSLGTFLAGDRGPAIRALILLVFSYFIIVEKKASILRFFFMIIIAGYFLSTIKLIGAVDFRSTDVVQSYIDAWERFKLSDRNASIIPFTAELSGSFRSYSTTFSLWHTGFSLYGISLFTGALMAIPMGVSTFMFLFGLSKESINTSYLVTAYSGESYGLGNSIIGDALINIGFVGSLLLAYLVGRLFIKIDFAFYKYKGSVYIYSIGCYLLMNSVGLARGSFFPLLGGMLFIFLLIALIKYLLNIANSTTQ